MVYASPFIHDDGRLIVIGSTDGSLRVLDSANGDLLCETCVNGEGLFSSPLCFCDLILVGSRDDHFYCYKLC